MDDLKPCPFCGFVPKGFATDGGQVVTECRTMDCPIRGRVFLAKGWDRRATDPTLTDLLEACRELIGSGVELDDARIGYVVVQIDRATLEFAREAIAKAEGRKP